MLMDSVKSLRTWALHGKWTTKCYSLRFVLTVIITGLIVAVSLSVLAIFRYGALRSLLMLTENMTTEISNGIIEKIENDLVSVENANAVVKLMITHGNFDPTDGQRLMEVAATLVAQEEAISSMEFALPDGSNYMAYRETDGSITRKSDVRTTTNVNRNYYYENPDFPNQQKNSIKSLENGYDARKQDWFKKVVSGSQAHWTDMYVSAALKRFTYSYVTPIFAKDGALLVVAVVDIDLKTLSRFLGTLKIVNRGKIFVMNVHDRIIALSVKSAAELDLLFKPSPKGSDELYQLPVLEELTDQDIRLAVLSYRRDGKRFFELTDQSGEPIIAFLVKHPFRSGSPTTIGILFPKSDITGDLGRNTRFMLLGLLLFLVFAVLFGLRIARSISSSLAVLCEEVDKVSRLELDSSRVVESRILEVARIDDSVRNMKRGLRSFKKYVPADLVLHLNALKKEAILEGEKRELSIFFSDIIDFTSIAEQMILEEFVGRLGFYFNGMSRIVLDNAGTLDKYMGDAIMAFWGAPLPRENHARLACASALRCQQFLDRLTIACAASHPVFPTRIGIHTGEAIVGNFGSEERMNYTIIGDAVNLASRLEGLNKFYQTRIIISADTFSRVQNDFIARKLDMVAVKGKTQGVLIYELIAARGDGDGAQATFLQTYDRAIELYLNRSWAEAKQAFAAAQQLSPRGRDYPSELLGARCEEFLRNPPPPEWNGVYTYKSK